MTSFNATPAGDAVDVRWVTESERDAAGFYLLRAAEDESEYRRVVDSLIPATAVRSSRPSTP